VDVLLAVMLVGLGALEAYFALRGVMLLLRGRVSDALLWFGAMVIYLLLLFPPILAFNAYAWGTGQTLAGYSRMYDAVNAAIGGVFKLPAQLISALLVLTLNAGSAYVNYVSKARTWLEIGANLLSILVAVQTLFAARRQRE
ncbi:hypothetical protein ACNJUT_21045, partial [Mycobacterium tuberculosis]